MSTMHTDRWESSQREAVLYLSLRLGLLALLRCMRAEEADVLIGISNFNLPKRIKEGVCNRNAVWWEGVCEYHCVLIKRESSFQASQGKKWSTRVDGLALWRPAV